MATNETTEPTTKEMGGFGFSAFHEHVESFFCNLKSMIYT
jgi:hypothetical protein